MRCLADKNELRGPGKLDQTVVIGRGGYGLYDRRDDFRLFFQGGCTHSLGVANARQRGSGRGASVP